MDSGTKTPSRSIGLLLDDDMRLAIVCEGPNAGCLVVARIGPTTTVMGAEARTDLANVVIGRVSRHFVERIAAHGELADAACAALLLAGGAPLAMLDLPPTGPASP